MAKLVSTVHVTDPERPGTSIRLEAGQDVPGNLAGQITNPDCWEDGKLPAAAKHAAAEQQGDDTSSQDDTEQAAPAAKKPAAKKTAASRSRGRTAADEGTSGE
ncbi:hypothetical protein [Streptomyces sp. NPDC005548]|uniref:hypothetical protein n=1 Tax=Streptomyces sp. NPDC005548 TaxID=3364724 RepID=UPI0036A95F83